MGERGEVEMGEGRGGDGGEGRGGEGSGEVWRGLEDNTNQCEVK